MCQNKTQTQTTMQNIPFSDTFGSRDVEKCTLLWRKARFEVKKMSNTLFQACCLSAGLRYFETCSSTNVEHTLGQATAGGLQRTCQNFFAQEQTFSLRSTSNCMSVGMHCYGLFLHQTGFGYIALPEQRKIQVRQEVGAQRVQHPYPRNGSRILLLRWHRTRGEQLALCG